MISPYTLLFTNPMRDEPEVKYWDPATDFISKIIPDGWPVSDKLSVARAYALNGWFRRCVDLRADALAAIPYTLRNRRTGDVIFDSEAFDPLPDKLDWLGDFEDLLRLREMSLVLTGRAYWRPLWKAGRRTGIQYIDPTTITEEYAADGSIAAYVRQYQKPDGTPVRQRWSPDSLIAFYQRDPFTEVGPGAPLGESVRTNADVLHSLHSFLDSFLDKGLLPATIIGLPANTSPEERSRFQEWWDSAFRGKNRAGTQRVVNADAVHVQKIGEGLSDISTPDLVREQRESIAAALGIPMSHLLPSAANRATSFQDDENLYTKALIPQAKRAMSDLNRQLFGAEGMYLRFEFKRIEALQRAMLEKARSTEQITGMPLLTRNEGRYIIGHPEVEGGDVFADEVDAARNLELAEAQAEAMLAQQDEEQGQPDERMSARAYQEIENWRRKVKKNGSTVEWNREHIPEHVYETIKARLESGSTDPFEPPYVDF